MTDVDERRKRVRVDLNGVSLWAAMKDVRQSGQSAQAAAPRAPQRVSPVKAAIANDDAPALRLDLRGMRADQAQAEVERFLDKAASVKWRSCTVAAPAPCVARSMIFCAPSRPWPVLPPLRRIAAAMA